MSNKVVRKINITENTFEEVNEWLNRVQQLCVPIPNWLKSNFVNCEFEQHRKVRSE